MIRRLFDIAVAISALIITSPLLVVSAATIRLTMGRPVIFRQTRSGLHGEAFEILKFRTMTRSTDAQGKLLPDELRRTPVGDFLRRSSIDELPELINVVRGEMAIVGPRPLLYQYNDLYSARHRRRLDVRPGVTGHVQVNGRNSLSWTDKLDLDVWYVENRSRRLDLYIIGKTFLGLARGLFVAETATDPAEVFNGFN